jgi:fatty-acyl-CoA synthase
MDQSLTKTELQLLQITKDLLFELESERALRAISLDASFEKELGIGSLERAELFHRIEKAFVVQLPDRLIAQADNLRDLIPAIKEANPPGRIHYHEVFPIVEESGVDPLKYTNLVDILQQYAEKEPQRVHIYLQDELGKEKIIRYSDLYEKARKTAKGLQQLGLHPNETVAIMLPTCDDFFYAFFGVLIAGGLPVPIYPPFRSDRIEEYAKREAKILKNAEVCILISFTQVKTLNKILRNFIPSLKTVVTVTDLMKSSHTLSPIYLTGHNNALIQYTSGSTGDPKGVLLTHNNLLSNIRAIGQAIQIKPTDIAVSWLPLYHDMGLIGSWLGSLYYGIPITIMSPLSFLNHPERWLWAIHYHRASLSAGPNFAYELCTTKIEDHAIEGLDLSSWRLAFNGAEAVYPKTIKNFIRRFGYYGLKTESIYPVYGLAESSVALTFPTLYSQARIDRIERDKFNHNQVATPCNEHEKNCVEFVSCGVPLPEHELRIVDANGNEVKERVIGSLQFRGPSSMQGYYKNPEATKAIYHDGWWESGDLAYKADKEVFITGRKKDVIIKGGRNLYPQEIEEITAQVKGVRKGCVVAFGATNSQVGTEQIVVVAETREQRQEQQESIKDKISKQITSAIGDPPDKIILVAPKTIPKTSSGKLQRSSTKELYYQEKLTKKQKPTWLQFAHLFLLSGVKKVGNISRKILRVFYSAYAFIIGVVSLFTLWLLLWFLPQDKAKKATRFWARTVLWAIGCKVSIEGEKHLQRKQPMIYVSNHTSYLDTVVLTAILPPDVLIVGKKELLKTPFLRHFLKKLGHLTVERTDYLESMSDTSLIIAKLSEGKSILLFPEGTFSYATGLRPFKLGAFKIATEISSPICPIAIRGTRQILRGTNLLLRPHRINIWVGRQLHPREKGWREATRLRTVIRIEIAKHCGENVLDIDSFRPATR